MFQPQIIGQGGWQQFGSAGGNNIIYAVDQAGRLLRYVDASQTGGGDVSAPRSSVRADGSSSSSFWRQRIIYAVVA
jgi:hypothetical protein